MRRTIMLGAMAGVLVAAAPRAARGAECALYSVGVAYGTPERLSAFLDSGCGFARKPGLLIAGAQVGLGGGELSAGVRLAAVGDGSVNLRAAIVQTRGRPLSFDVDRTLVGTRLEYSFVGGVLSANAGVLFPLSDDQQRTPRFTWGVGVGIPVWIFSFHGIGNIEM
jgi:hypothetical protein